MADSITSLNGATTVSSAGFGAARAGQQVSKAVIAKLLGSIEQAGQSAAQATPNRVDRVQISDAGRRLLAAE